MRLFSKIIIIRPLRNHFVLLANNYFVNWLMLVTLDLSGKKKVSYLGVDCLTYGIHGSIVLSVICVDLHGSSSFILFNCVAI